MSETAVSPNQSSPSSLVFHPPSTTSKQFNPVPSQVPSPTQTLRGSQTPRSDDNPFFVLLSKPTPDLYYELALTLHELVRATTDHAYTKSSQAQAWAEGYINSTEPSATARQVSARLASVELEGEEVEAFARIATARLRKEFIERLIDWRKEENV